MLNSNLWNQNIYSNGLWYWIKYAFAVLLIVPLSKMDRMQEVLTCESELLEGNIYTPMPVFLNLSFDEVRVHQYFTTCRYVYLPVWVFIILIPACQNQVHVEGNIWFFFPLRSCLPTDFPTQLCHQGRGDEHMMICAVIKEGDDLYPLRR